MKIHKFVGATMREALSQVRNALGQEAVILSNRDTPQGVELLAIAEQHLNEVVTPSEADLAAVAPAARGVSERANPLAGRNGSERSNALPARSGSERASAPDVEAPARRTAAEAPSNSLLDMLRGRRSESAATAPQPIARNSGERALERGVERPAERAVERAGERPVERMSERAAERAEPMRAAAPSRQAVATRGAPEGGNVRAGARPAAAVALPADPAPVSEAELLAELRSLRGLMEQRFSALAWHENIKRRPRAASLMWELLAAGFSTALARAAVNAVPDEYETKMAREWLYGQLVPKLKCIDGEADLVARGGIYAFTGPTGVGKTTTAAKIAARCVVKHGADSLGLVTTDTYRIGAHDQLRVFGRILGVPVHAVHDAMGLSDVLGQLSAKRLVLVDTIGMGQRDDRVADQHQMLDACGVRKLVLMSATSQLEALEDVVDAYAQPVQVEPALGAIITKIDEAVKLGSILDVLIRHRMPLVFVANGQRVPEDLMLPNCRDLVRAALSAPPQAHSKFSAEDAALFASWTMSEQVLSGVAHA
jgi:flagellar biosynthesis protein FlhF